MNFTHDWCNRTSFQTLGIRHSMFAPDSNFLSIQCSVPRKPNPNRNLTSNPNFDPNSALTLTETLTRVTIARPNFGT